MAGTRREAEGGDGSVLEALRERWFACSCALGWVSAGEWQHPTVDLVCEAVSARLEGRGPAGVEKALQRWAGARAAAGLSLAETLTDLAALHTAVSGLTDGDPATAGSRANGAAPTDGAHLLSAVSLAWTDVACGELAESSAVDPLSGLASALYLRNRLLEVYRGARASGARAGDGHALVVTTMPVRGWMRVAPLVTAGRYAGQVFDAGETIAAVGRGSVVVLAPREGLAERARVLRRVLARRLTSEVGVDDATVPRPVAPLATQVPRPVAPLATPSTRIVALPATHTGACALLERLAARDDHTRTL